MSKTRRNRTGTKGRGTYLRGWARQQPGNSSTNSNDEKVR